MSTTQAAKHTPGRRALEYLGPRAGERRSHSAREAEAEVRALVAANIRLLSALRLARPFIAMYEPTTESTKDHAAALTACDAAIAKAVGQ